ncbi:hypothetical protein ACKJSM_13920 [Pseudomonas sp. PHC1]
MRKSFAGSEDGAIARRFGRPVYRHRGGFEAIAVFGGGFEEMFQLVLSTRKHVSATVFKDT